VPSELAFLMALDGRDVHRKAWRRALLPLRSRNA
jgi:hypothetical protein